MANYYATARSNYFRVKNPKAFKKWAENLYLEVINQKTEAGETLYGVLSDDGDGWPSFRNVPTGPEGGESPADENIDFPAELSSHLAQGEVAILMEVGSENCRYLTGAALAITSDGRFSQIVLDDIYKQASREFGIPETQITSAAY